VGNGYEYGLVSYRVGVVAEHDMPDHEDELVAPEPLLVREEHDDEVHRD
jgi:hypothetical protein